MKQVTTTISGYWGGLANSPYEPLNKQSFQTAKNLDVYKFTNLLTPVNNLVERALDPIIATNEASSFYFASNGKLYLLGDTGTSNQLRIYSANIGPTFSLTTVGSSSVSNTAPTPFVDGQSTDGRFHIAELGGYLLFWEGVLLSRVLLSGPTFASDPYTWSHGGTTGPIFTHEGMRKSFIAVDNKVYTLDSDSVSGSADPKLALVLDNKYIIRSFCSFGRFLAIGAQVKKDAGTSKVFIYNGSAINVEDVIDVGDVGLQSIRNVNGVIHVLITRFTFGDLNNYTRVYVADGSSFRMADEIIMSSSPPSTISGLEGTQFPHLINDSSVAVNGDIMYWSYKGWYNQANYSGLIGITNGIYAYGKLEVNQPRILSLLATTATAMGNHNATALSVINNNLYLTYAGTEVSTQIFHFENQLDNYISATLTPGVKSGNGVYESNIFPLDGKTGANRGKITSIELQHEPIPTSTGFTMAIKHYGAYEKGGTVSTDSYADLLTPQGSGSSTGKTQSTNNATYTIIDNNNSFKKATHAQIKISFDEVSGVSAPKIVFPSITIKSLTEE
jgi:hypothetical protein